MKRLTLEEFLDELSGGKRLREENDGWKIHGDNYLQKIRADVADRENKPTALVLFRNQLMDSSNLGAMTTMMVGPGYTYEDVDSTDKRVLGDVPSRMQWPQGYILLEDLEGE